MRLGLRHEDPKLTLERVEGAIQNYIDGGGDVARLYEAASRALRLSGVLGAAAQQMAQAEIEEDETAAERAADDPPEPALP